jgi:PIN domain nuclease of toxin-antitoxin system
MFILALLAFGRIAIKLSIGKLSLNKDYETIGVEVESSDITLLPISFADTAQVRKLPLHHRDPFDRILVAQAMNNYLVIVSQDIQLDAYCIERLWT